MKFVHTLAVPEHIWVDFFRVFFQQRYLLSDADGNSIENRFRYEHSALPDNRSFDILFESDLTGSNPNILPCLVIEDSGTAQSGILLNQLRTWAVAPNAMRDRSDLMRSVYTFHCCARTRGESRLMASIVGSAVTVFRDALMEAGLHKIEPWSIGKSMPLKADVDEVYVDTPVTVNFSYQEGWRTVESYEYFWKNCFRTRIVDDSVSAYFRSLMTVSDPWNEHFFRSSMFLENINTESFILSSLTASDPLSSSTFIRSQVNVENPLTVENFVRTSMRVS